VSELSAVRPGTDLSRHARELVDDHGWLVDDHGWLVDDHGWVARNSGVAARDRIAVPRAHTAQTVSPTVILEIVS